MGSADDDEAFAKKVNARFQSFRKGETTAAGELDVHVEQFMRPFVLRLRRSPLRDAMQKFFFFLFFFPSFSGHRVRRVRVSFFVLFFRLKTCRDRGV